ncbi:hypothetical protein GCM10027614_77430 [Micromonospora vulcania]
MLGDRQVQLVEHDVAGELLAQSPAAQQAILSLPTVDGPSAASQSVTAISGIASSTKSTPATTYGV